MKITGRLPGRTASFRTLAAGVLLSAAGCSAPPNPSFPLETKDAEAALSEMARDPKPFERPVVVIGGHMDPGIASSSIAERLCAVCENPRLVRVNVNGVESMAEARQRVMDAVEAAWPSGDPVWSVEVDVVANSMGGLVAASASDPSAGERALRIQRLFTIGTPFLGADAARLPTSNPVILSMRAGSDFLRRTTPPGRCLECELIPYTRSDDQLVGAANTAPPGVTPWWVPAEFFQSGHITAYKDPRIVADVARRLRGEAPFTREPRTPLPSDAESTARSESSARSSRSHSRDSRSVLATSGSSAASSDAMH